MDSQSQFIAMLDRELASGGLFSNVAGNGFGGGSSSPWMGPSTQYRPYQPGGSFTGGGGLNAPQNAQLTFEQLLMNLLNGSSAPSAAGAPAATPAATSSAAPTAATSNATSTPASSPLSQLSTPAGQDVSQLAQLLSQLGGFTRLGGNVAGGAGSTTGQALGAVGSGLGTVTGGLNFAGGLESGNPFQATGGALGTVSGLANLLNNPLIAGNLGNIGGLATQGGGFLNGIGGNTASTLGDIGGIAGGLGGAAGIASGINGLANGASPGQSAAQLGTGTLGVYNALHALFPNVAPPLLTIGPGFGQSLVGQAYNGISGGISDLFSGGTNALTNAAGGIADAAGTAADATAAGATGIGEIAGPSIDAAATGAGTGLGALYSSLGGALGLSNLLTSGLSFAAGANSPAAAKDLSILDQIHTYLGPLTGGLDTILEGVAGGIIQAVDPKTNYAINQGAGQVGPGITSGLQSAANAGSGIDFATASPQTLEQYIQNAAPALMAAYNPAGSGLGTSTSQDFASRYMSANPGQAQSNINTTDTSFLQSIAALQKAGVSNDTIGGLVNPSMIPTIGNLTAGMPGGWAGSADFASLAPSLQAGANQYYNTAGNPNSPGSGFGTGSYGDNMQSPYFQSNAFGGPTWYLADQLGLDTPANFRQYGITAPGFNQDYIQSQMPGNAPPAPLTPGPFAGGTNQTSADSGTSA